MYEWLLIILELAILVATGVVYLLARRTAASAAATQKSLDELLQELQATSEIVINDLNTRTAALRTLLEQSDGRRHALESNMRPAPARMQAAQQQALAKPAASTKPGKSTARDGRPDTPSGSDPSGNTHGRFSGSRGAEVQRLATEGMDPVRIAQQLRLTREEVHMILAGSHGGSQGELSGSRSTM
jgi:hypothetical protein